MKLVYTLALASLIFSACSNHSTETSPALDRQSVEAAAVLTKTSGEGNFGAVSTSKLVVLVVKNLGDATSGLLSPALGGADAAAFSLPYTSGCGSSLAPGYACTLRVYFNAAHQASGSYSAQLTVGDLVIPLTAEIPTPATPALNLALTEGQVDVSGGINFGSLVKSQSVTKILTLKNLGTTTSGLVSVGLNNSHYQVLASSCNKSLNAGESCIIRLIAASAGKTNGSYNSSLTITRVGSPEPLVVAVTSSVDNAPVVSTPQGVNLVLASDNQPVSALTFTVPQTQGFTRLYSLTNTGTATSSPLTLSLTGANAANFSLLSNNCVSKSLAPGKSCSVRLVFSSVGNAAGAYAAALSVGDKNFAISATVLASTECPVNSELQSGMCVAVGNEGNGVDEYTKLLLNFENVIQDQSSYSKSLVTDGTLSYIPGKFGQGLNFATNPSRVQIPSGSDSDFDFGSGDFTIDFQMALQPAQQSGNHHILNRWSVHGSQDWYIVQFGNTLRFGINGQTNFDVAAPEVLDGNFHHVAYQRQGNFLVLFVDGKYKGLRALNVSLPFTPSIKLTVGGISDDYLDRFRGQIDSVRVSKGIARYPISLLGTNGPGALTSDAQTLAFLDFEGDALDQSSLARTPTTASLMYNSADSISFATPGSNLLATSGPELDLSNGNFTIDFQAQFPNGVSGNKHLINRYLGSGDKDWYVVTVGNSLRFFVTGGGTWDRPLPPTVGNGEFHHIAISRNGNIIRMFCDGNQLGADISYSGTIPFHPAVDLSIGRIKDFAGDVFDGVLRNLRIEKAALFSAPFAPPATVAATANTVLLLNSVGVIEDSSLYNHPLTNLGPVVINGVKQGMMAGNFSPANSMVQFAYDPSMNFVNSDFTIETWLKPKDVGNYQTILGSWNYNNGNTGNWFLISSPGGAINFGFGNGITVASTAGPSLTMSPTDINGSFNYTNGLYHHLAVVRKGNTLTMFYDGLPKATSTISGTMVLTPDYWTVGSHNDSFSFRYSGLLDDLRISNVARYNLDFTAPTAPYGE